MREVLGKRDLLMWNVVRRNLDNDNLSMLTVFWDARMGNLGDETGFRGTERVTK